jgi:small subunit ribosomal protein S21
MNITRRPQKSKMDRFKKKVKEVTNRIELDEGGFNALFRKFKRRTKKDGIIQELRERRHYIKPSEKRKVALQKAIKREKKRNETIA